MAILYALVARGSVVLAEYSPMTTTANAIARQILEKIPGNNDTNVSYSQDRYIFHVKRTDGLTILCMADDTAGRMYNLFRIFWWKFVFCLSIEWFGNVNSVWDFLQLEIWFRDRRIWIWVVNYHRKRLLLLWYWMLNIIGTCRLVRGLLGYKKSLDLDIKCRSDFLILNRDFVMDLKLSLFCS